MIYSKLGVPRVHHLTPPYRHSQFLSVVRDTFCPRRVPRTTVVYNSTNSTITNRVQYLISVKKCYAHRSRVASTFYIPLLPFNHSILHIHHSCPLPRCTRRLSLGQSSTFIHNSSHLLFREDRYGSWTTSGCSYIDHFNPWALFNVHTFYLWQQRNVNVFHFWAIYQSQMFQFNA